MNVDLATSVISARSALTQHSVGIAVMKKAHEMQTELLTTLLQSAPPPGQGARVDKTA